MSHSGSAGSAPGSAGSAADPGAEAQGWPRSGARAPLRLTPRGVLLFLVLFALAATAVYPLRAYVAQRNRILTLEAKHQALQAENDRLAREQARLNDPAHIEQLAKRDFHMARPGEETWQLNGTPPPDRPVARQTTERHRSWAQRVWERLTGWVK
ncbi:MAG TPA: septum formation initiator family protein [Actinomycetes bacterium]|nr:septum formation initiator family protein [Actinomycetes bacterium]